jgi:hypothetical protein
MSQSLPIARIRLVKVEVSGQPPMTQDESTARSRAERQRGTVNCQDPWFPGSRSAHGQGARRWEQALPLHETTLLHGLP